MDLAADDRLAHARWHRVEHDSRPAKPLVQSFICKHESVVRDFRLQAPTMTFPTHATEFENIGEIGVEFDRQNKIDSCASVVMNAKPLVTRFIPQNLRAKDVYRSSWHYDLAVAPDVGVRSVYSENRVVLSHRRAKQQRPI